MGNRVDGGYKSVSSLVKEKRSTHKKAPTNIKTESTPYRAPPCAARDLQTVEGPRPFGLGCGSHSGLGSGLGSGLASSFGQPVFGPSGQPMAGQRLVMAGTSGQWLANGWSKWSAMSKKKP